MPHSPDGRTLRHRVVLRVLVVGCASLSGGCAARGALLPRGTDAHIASRLWWFMLALGGAITVGWLALFAVGLLRGGRVGASEADDARTHRRFVIGGGLVLPALALGSLYVYDVVALADMPQGGEVVVEATGHQFWWELTYPEPGFTTANEMYIPTGTDVRVRLRSADVIHSFWVPQLAGKRDMIPGRVNELTLHATEPGRYAGECAEFCGIQHATMRLHVVAVSPDDYGAWLARMDRPAAEPRTSAQRAGYETFMTSSCVGCHSIRGTPADGQLGPALTHFASRELLGAGAAPNDRGHLGGWVANAQNLKPGNQMPPTNVAADDLRDLLIYLESLE